MIRRSLATLGLLCITALSTQALAQERVVIAAYAGQGAQMFRSALTGPFEKETGIKSSVFESPLPSASVQRAEGKPTFNVAIIGPYDMTKLADAGTIEPIDPADIPNLKNVPEAYQIKDSAGRLVGVSIYVSYYGIAYNTELAKPQDFQSWEDLANPKWKGQISISRAPFVAAYDVTLFSKLKGGNETNAEPGFKMLGEVIKNVSSVYSSMASIQAQLGRGEVIAAPFYSTQIAMLRRSGVSNVDIVTPKEGGLQLPYTLVIPKGAFDRKAAAKLINAALGEDYQLRIAQEQGVWPTNVATKLPDSLKAELGGDLEAMRARNYIPDWAIVSRNHANRTRQVEAIMSGVQ